jgi:hypothetical protein
VSFSALAGSPNLSCAGGSGLSDQSDSLVPPDQGRPGVYRVYYADEDGLAELYGSFDIWTVDREATYAVMPLTATDVDLIKSQGYRPVLAAIETQGFALGPPGYPCYKDVDELYAAMNQAQVNYPVLVELIDYGDSWQKLYGASGYDLWVLKLTNSQMVLPKPRLFVMANIHGREITTPETALHFANYLLEGYGTDPDATWILDYREVYVVLTANPDGRQLVEEGCSQRKNRNESLGSCRRCDLWGTGQYGVDLNRNNAYHWGGAGLNSCGLVYQGSAPASEPETYYLNDLIRSLFPDQRLDDDVTQAAEDTSGLLISLHSYGQQVFWPWGWTSASAPNHVQLQTLGRKFAFHNDYWPGQGSGITGDTTDWAYGELGIPAYTFELGEYFFQPCADLQQIMDENLGALLYAAKVAGTPYQTASGPDALDLRLEPRQVVAGARVQLSATIDDSRYSRSHGSEPVQEVASAAYYIDDPPGASAGSPTSYSMTAGDGDFDKVVETVIATIDTSALAAGQHTVFVRGRDANGDWGALSAVFLDVTAGEREALYIPILRKGR